MGGGVTWEDQITLPWLLTGYHGIEQDQVYEVFLYKDKLYYLCRLPVE